MKKEKIVLVHAAWLGAWQWGAVSKKLSEEGYEVITPDLPGHGANKRSPEDVSMDDYVDAILDVLDKQDEPVILVGHSFNGITVSRVAELRPEKVNKLVYLTAFMVPNGVSFIQAVQGVKGSDAVDNFYISDDHSYALVKEEKMHKAFAQDVPESDFNEAKTMIVPQPLGPLLYELQVTDANFGKLPKYYIECTMDNAIPVEIQRAMYAGKVIKSYSLESGHTPNFSQPEELAEIIMEIASD